MPPPVVSGLDASPWPLYRGNLLRTGREAGSGSSLAPGLAAPPRVDWTFFPNQSYGAPRAAAAPVLSSPAIGADGSIYYGSLDGYVYALFADGAARLVFASTALGSRYSAERRALARTSQTGSVKWRYKAGAPVAASPCVGNRVGALRRMQLSPLQH